MKTFKLIASIGAIIISQQVFAGSIIDSEERTIYQDFGKNIKYHLHTTQFDSSKIKTCKGSENFNIPNEMMGIIKLKKGKETPFLVISEDQRIIPTLDLTDRYLRNLFDGSGELSQMEEKLENRFNGCMRFTLKENSKNTILKVTLRTKIGDMVMSNTYDRHWILKMNNKTGKLMAKRFDTNFMRHAVVIPLWGVREKLTQGFRKAFKVNERLH